MTEVRVPLNRVAVDGDKREMVIFIDDVEEFIRQLRKEGQ